MSILNALIVALLASGAVGSAVALLIQLGKLFVPGWFPDGSADNWRLGTIALVAVAVLVLRAFGAKVEVADVENAAVSLSALSLTLMPLLVLFASWVSKGTYSNLLKGAWKIGKSHSPTL